MNDFDVVVIGAGPAGGQMGRVMAKSGYKVLLVDQQETFANNDFSSAVTLLNTLEEFKLPDEIIGSFWNRFIAITTNTKQVWDSSQNLGVILDFAKLKAFLANEVKIYGGEVWLGCRYLKHCREDGETQVILKHRGKQTLEIVRTKVLVDATGFSRSVMYDKPRNQPNLLSATGIEYLIQVDEQSYQKYANSIFFFLGYQWMPKGYSWILPMNDNRLKVGAGRFNLQHKYIQNTGTIQDYIQHLIDEHISPENYEIIDIHGSTIKYCQGLKDIYYQDSAIAIGDAVSTVNFLGGEGIRHGMYSADVAAGYVTQYLENKITDFRKYPRQMRKQFLPQWDISAKAGVKKYLMESDTNIDEAFTYLGFLKTEELIDVLFHYKLSKLNKGFLRYLKYKLLLFIDKYLKSSKPKTYQT
ncbi:MAG: FAD-dependent oxidoreductase [Cyanobacteria bacterium]|nr:FAD-dependent oxidoreductase [Cyanobacteria bacterium GSL.Bin21]